MKFCDVHLKLQPPCVNPLIYRIWVIRSKFTADNFTLHLIFKQVQI